MHQEEGSIYSLDIINNGALLQKRRAKPFLSDCSWTVLPYQFFEKSSRSKNCQFQLLQKLKKPAALMKELAILWLDL